MPDTKPAKVGGSRTFLGAYKPAKPIGDMTEAELDAWCLAVADAMIARLSRPAAETDAKGSLDGAAHPRDDDARERSP